jgi:AcrR family transcriptional regulator
LAGREIKGLPPAHAPRALAAFDPPPNKVGQSLGPKGVRTRRRIMDAAAKLLTERSFADVRITDIARAAHVAQPNFYTYFASVDDVIHALAEEVSLDPLARHLETDWSGPEGVALARQLIEASFALWAGQRGILALAWFLADKRQGDFPDLRIRQVRTFFKAFEAQIRRSQDAGRISRAVNARLAGYECVGLISSAAIKYELLRESGFSHRHLVETNARLVHTIVTGIAMPVEP